MTDAHKDDRDGAAKGQPTPGSLPQEKVEDRDNVGTARPEDYPKEDRDDGDVAAANRGKRADKHGSGPVSGSGAGAGGGGIPEDYDDDPQGGGGHKPVATDTGPNTGADAPVGGSR
ncbi:hypothetical protein [Sphingopyxis sp.]|uniref:hypothetical protein n=1 Tax=Sphingopyxis sp. TaxID=1908224 RepID=UPI003BAD1751